MTTDTLELTSRALCDLKSALTLALAPQGRWCISVHQRASSDPYEWIQPYCAFCKHVLPLGTVEEHEEWCIVPRWQALFSYVEQELALAGGEENDAVTGYGYLPG